MCENIDWNVGRLLKLLDQLSLAEDTIVVFFCDNGPNGNRWNEGMKGRKGSTDEGGVRSPLFIRWPGKIPAGKRMAHIASVIDLMPTLAELAESSSKQRSHWMACHWLHGSPNPPLLFPTDSSSPIGTTR